MDERALQSSRRLRLRLLLGLLLLAGGRLAWTLFEIQVVRHAGYEARAQRQQERRIVVPARRGAIYDRNGAPLAVSRERYALYLVPNHVRDPREFIEAFTSVVSYPEDELRARLARGGFYVPLRRTVDRPTLRRLEAAGIPGLGVETRHERYYPHGRLAAAVLGQVDPDSRGIAGLELQYDHLLRGEDGWSVHQRDAAGREYANFAFPTVQPVNGNDLHLTLDLGLQEIGEEALDEAMAGTRSRTGSIVIADPRTGEVLAMANRPDGEVSGARGLLRNHAVADLFEPGSTFKIVTLAGLYEEQLAGPDEEIFCENGTYRFAGRAKPIRDVHPYGTLTVEEVIGKSSNICTIKLAQRLGEERMFEYARRFGFGLPAGLDFPGEARGVLRLPRDWSALSAYSIAMGYEVSVTALQLTMMFAAIANGGELLQPYLVGRVAAPAGETLLRRGPRRVRRVVSRETAARVAQALVRVVQDGTGTAADLALLQVAGKSGTARKIRDGGGGYASDRFNATFGGFFPAQDPRLVVLVRLDDPQGAYYGGLVAGPVFKKAVQTTLFTEPLPVDPSFLSRIRDPGRIVRLAASGGGTAGEVAYGPPPALERYGAGDASEAYAPVLAPSEPGPPPAEPNALPAARSSSPVGPNAFAPAGPREAQAGSAGVEETTADETAVRPAGAEPGPAFLPAGAVRVPDFTAMSLREALVVASQRGLALAFGGPGAVLSQSPAAGEIVAVGSEVRVENAGQP